MAKAVLTDEMIDRLVDKVMEIKPDKPTSRLIFEKQLADVSAQIENLVNAVQMGIVSDTTRAHLAELEQQKAELERRIAECGGGDYTPERAAVVEYIRSLREYSNMNDEIKRVIVDVFVEGIYINKNSVNIKSTAINDTFDL